MWISHVHHMETYLCHQVYHSHCHTLWVLSFCLQQPVLQMAWDYWVALVDPLLSVQICEHQPGWNNEELLHSSTGDVNRYQREYVKIVPGNNQARELTGPFLSRQSTEWNHFIFFNIQRVTYVHVLCTVLSASCLISIAFPWFQSRGISISMLCSETHSIGLPELSQDFLMTRM